MQSQYIFDDGKIKSKLVRHDVNWFVGEWKNSTDNKPWFPWICGTREWLCLSDEEVSKSYPPKKVNK